MNKSSFEVTLLNTVLINGPYLKNTKKLFVEKYIMRGYDFYMTVTRSEKTTRKTLF